MKALLLTCSLAINFLISYAQTYKENFRYVVESNALPKTELADKLSNYDFSVLFNYTDNSVVYGFIGDDYRRIRIKFISITKDSLAPNTYNVYGKSMVKNNIDEFRGKIKINAILKLKVIKHGCENGYEYKGNKGQFSLVGEYSFVENPQQNHSGTFKGKFRSDFFLSRNNNIKYDDIENCSDGYTNNQFIGEWKNQTGTIVKKCNWGDYRIPNSGDLDIGAAEFSPDDKYLKYGWQTRKDYVIQSSPVYKKAKQIEDAKWWKN